jgi:hypothetical protein
MRIASFGATLLIALAACSSTETTESPFLQPNSLMTVEIDRRVEQIPYQHRDELLQNLLWLAQTGEQTIPALLNGLKHENPKVRSSSAWVLGRLRDRRTIPNLQAAVRDSDPTVRLEVARTLVLLGDLAWCPNLIEGLDSDRKEVRFMCHEALKTATANDFGYDHLNQNEADLRVSVLRWRQWWSEYSGDGFFAQSYQKKYGVTLQPAAPMAEVKMQPSPPPVPQPAPQQMPENGAKQPQDGADAPMIQDMEEGADDGVQNAEQPAPTPAPAPTPRPNNRR